MGQMAKDIKVRVGVDPKDALAGIRKIQNAFDGITTPIKQIKNILICLSLAMGVSFLLGFLFGILISKI